MKALWKRLSNLGVNTTQSQYEQKSITLSNQIAMAVSVFLSVMIFLMYFLHQVLFVVIGLGINVLLSVLVLVLNSYNKTNTSRFLLSVIPALVIVLSSAISKSIGMSATVIFYITPRMGTIIACIFPVLLFGLYDKKRMFLALIWDISMLVFYDQIHEFFGVYIQNLPYLSSQYSAITAGSTLIIIFMIAAILFLQILNIRFESEIRKQKDILEEQKEEIEEQRNDLNQKNEKITSSINYARRIQTAMLPRQEILQNLLPESFILFRPRELVSGDFYFFVQKNEKIIIAAIDCTGHGIPGAFMSLIGNDLLNDIILSKNILNPDQILTELHKGVRFALKQEETENRDGMDLALCVFDKKNNILEFAGAKNPLILIQNQVLSQTKGDSNPIGGLQKINEERSFTKHTFKTDIPTTVYIFSDGFQDQFGGELSQKFMIKNLRDLLLEIHEKPMPTQKQILEKTFENWLGIKNKQIDDVLLIGFKC
ncbi:MAG: hypothetical protein EAZ97_15485 [Bacteroidetes bacterium]|nr:MAG: hypothetical protein EAZ97_15485 [Bacteroidota bacterium]